MLKQQHNIAIDKKKIVMPDALKTTGEHKVEIKVYPEISAKVTVKILGE